MVNFLDNSGPAVVFCPPSRIITSEKRQIGVTWPEPLFEDNSNDPLQITCSRKSGTVFYWGSYTIHCRAYDNNPDNKPAVCKFNLTIKGKYQIWFLARTVGTHSIPLRYLILENLYFQLRLSQLLLLENSKFACPFSPWIQVKNKRLR